MLKTEYQYMLRKEKFEIEYAFCVNNYLKEKMFTEEKYITLYTILLPDISVPVLFGDDTDYFETFEKFWSRGYKSVMAGEKLRIIDRAEIVRSVETGVDIGGSHNFLFYDEKLHSKIENLF
jgi:hypothetical protein